MSPTRLNRSVTVGGQRKEISVIVEEGVSGWQSLHNPDREEDTCFVYAKAHPSKPGHKVSVPYRYQPGDFASPIKHIGDFQTKPVDIFNRVDRDLSFTAQWIPPQPGLTEQKRKP